MPLTDDVVVRRRRVSVREQTRLQTRESILDAAAAAFVERGYNGTSLREIAVRANLSHTGLSHHFPDKAALMEALLDDRLEGPTRSLPLDSDDGEVFLRALVDLATYDEQNPAGIALFTILSAEALAPSHPAHGYFKRWHATVRFRIEKALLDVQRRGLYRGTVTPAQAALHISSMRDGLNLEWLLARDRIDFADTIRTQLLQYVDLVL